MLYALKPLISASRWFRFLKSGTRILVCNIIHDANPLTKSDCYCYIILTALAETSKVNHGCIEHKKLLTVKRMYIRLKDQWMLLLDFCKHGLYFCLCCLTVKTPVDLSIAVLHPIIYSNSMLSEVSPNQSCLQ